MKLLILSDTHGSLMTARKVILAEQDVEQFLHLGDFQRDARNLARETGLLYTAVKGNCDSYYERDDKILNAGGVKILLTHGHHYNVKMSYDALIYKGQEEKADLVLFGHTHLPAYFEEENTVFYNPGSIARPKNDIKSYGILTIEKGRFQIEHKEWAETFPAISRVFEKIKRG